MHHSKAAASCASFDAGSQLDRNPLLHNRVEHDEVSDLILDQDEDHAASPLRTYYESSGPGTVERMSATSGASPSVSSVLMSAIGGAFPMDDDFAPHSSSSSFDIGYPNFSSFGSGPSANSGGLDEHDLQFSSSPLHFPSHSRHTAPASSQLQPLHAPQHRPPRDLDATQASQQQTSIDEEAKEIIARLYVASARPSPAWFEQHQCGSILHVTTSDASSTSSTSSPSSEPMSVEMDPSHITSRTVVVLLEHRSGGVASLDSSLKHAADVVLETLGLDPKRSVLLRAGAASDGGDESQQQHEADEHEVVAATAMAYLVAGAKLSLRVAVEQLTTVLGSDRVQRMGDGFKRQLMAIETHVSRRPPSHDFFAPPTPTANVEAVASAPAPTQSGPATGGQAQPATKAIKAEGPDGWSSVSEGATNKMVVLSSSHPALPADTSVSSSSTSTQSSLRPPTSAPQASSTRSPQQSAPSTPMLSPRSSSQPTSPNPYGESDSPTDSAGGKRPRTESSSGGGKEQPPSKRRGPYRCGRCGMPKRGHSCPESSKGQDGPSAQSPAVSTPNTGSLSSCPSTPAAPVVVAAVPAKAELPPPASLPPSASCTDASSASSLSSSTSAAAATVATASDESAANAAGTPSAGPSGPAAAPAAVAAAASPSYDELMSKIAELTRDRDYYKHHYLALVQDGAADHLPSGEQLQLQQRAVKPGVSSGLSTPDRRQPQPQQSLVSPVYPAPSRSSLAEHHNQQQQRYQQQQQQQQQQQSGGVVHSPASAHSPSHPLPLGSRYQPPPQQLQYYPQQQQHTHHALMRTSSSGDIAGGAAYSSPSSSPYLVRHVGSSRSGLVSSSPAAATTTAGGGGRFTIGGRFGPDASGFYSPSHHHRTTREPNGGGGPAFHYSSPSFAHSSSTVATHPTQQLVLPHFANPTAVAVASLEDQPPPPPPQSSTSSVVSPSLGTSASSPLSLKAAEDFYWDFDFCTTTNG